MMRRQVWTQLSDVPPIVLNYLTDLCPNNNSFCTQACQHIWSLHLRKHSLLLMIAAIGRESIYQSRWEISSHCPDSPSLLPGSLLILPQPSCLTGEESRRFPWANRGSLPFLYCVTLWGWCFPHFLQLVRLVFGTFTMFARVIPAQKVCVVFELEDSWFKMVCLFQVYSKVIRLYIYIYSFSSRFFPHIGYHRILSRVPCAIQ